jgi:7-keto-8-aminopelargonate synthetase-like enzyme
MPVVRTEVAGSVWKVEVAVGQSVAAGDALVIDWLVQHSGPFRYTTALAPPLAAGALAALQQLQELEHRHQAPGAELLLKAQRWRDQLDRRQHRHVLCQGN